MAERAWQNKQWSQRPISHVISILLAGQMAKIEGKNMPVLFAGSGLEIGELRGLAPKIGPGSLVSALRGGSIGDFTLTDSLRASYIGHAVKKSVRPER